MNYKTLAGAVTSCRCFTKDSSPERVCNSRVSWPRRQFLAGLAAVGAGSLLSAAGRSLHGGGASTKNGCKTSPHRHPSSFYSAVLGRRANAGGHEERTRKLVY